MQAVAGVARHAISAALQAGVSGYLLKDATPDALVDAARNAVETAARSVRDLRIAEVIRQDLVIENGGVTSFRVRLGISFKYEGGD